MRSSSTTTRTQCARSCATCWGSNRSTRAAVGLIFALPPAELGIQPIDDSENGFHELYLMCDDIEQTVNELTAKGVEFLKPIENAGFGLVTRFKIPGGAELALYQPRHPTAISLDKA